MKSIGIVIQARMGSKRLPGKVLMDFCGKPMLLFQIELIKHFSLDIKIVVATSNNPLDDAIEKLCIKESIPFVRGSEENVFQRFQLAAEEFQFDSIVRLTGDNPLTNYQILKTCLDVHKQTEPSLTSTREILPDCTVKRYAPKGSSVDIIDTQTLLDINSCALDEFQREHVIPVFFDRGCDLSIVDDFNYLNTTNSIDNFVDYKKVIMYVQDLIERNKLLDAVGYSK